MQILKQNAIFIIKNSLLKHKRDFQKLERKIYLLEPNAKYIYVNAP